jgi:hypothetical protein
LFPGGVSIPTGKTLSGDGGISLAGDIAGAQGNFTDSITSVNNITAGLDISAPAGGNGVYGFFFGSDVSAKILWGSGAPTASAPKGSLYLRTNGSGTSDRLYVNTDAGTTWTAVATVG